MVLETGRSEIKVQAGLVYSGGLVHRWLSFCHLQQWKGQRISLGSLLKTLMPFMRTLPSRYIHLQKVSLSKTIFTLRIRILSYKFWGNTFRLLQVCTEGRWCEHTGRKWPPANKRESGHGRDQLWQHFVLVLFASKTVRKQISVV